VESVPSHAPATRQTLDHCFGGAGARRAADIDPEHELDRVGQRLLEHGREAIGRNHVEADPGADDDAGRARLRVPRMGGDEHVDLTGDVEIMSSCLEAGVDHRPARRRERTGAVHDRLHVAEPGDRSRFIIHVEDAPRQVPRRRERLDRRRAAAGQHQAKTFLLRLARHKSAGEAIRAVDQECAGIGHPFSPRFRA
jgi:hypothetical protein